MAQEVSLEVVFAEVVSSVFHGRPVFPDHSPFQPLGFPLRQVRDDFYDEVAPAVFSDGVAQSGSGFSRQVRGQDGVGAASLHSADADVDDSAPADLPHDVDSRHFFRFSRCSTALAAVLVRRKFFTRHFAEQNFGGRPLAVHFTDSPHSPQRAIRGSAFCVPWPVTYDNRPSTIRGCRSVIRAGATC